MPDDIYTVPRIPEECRFVACSSNELSFTARPGRAPHQDAVCFLGIRGERFKQLNFCRLKLAQQLMERAYRIPRRAPAPDPSGELPVYDIVVWNGQSRKEKRRARTDRKCQESVAFRASVAGSAMQSKPMRRLELENRLLRREAEETKMENSTLTEELQQSQLATAEMDKQRRIASGKLAAAQAQPVAPPKSVAQSNAYQHRLKYGRFSMPARWPSERESRCT
jgi:hypothetical protein